MAAFSINSSSDKNYQTAATGLFLPVRLKDFNGRFFRNRITNNSYDHV